MTERLATVYGVELRTAIHIGLAHDNVSDDDFADLLEKIMDVVDDDPKFQGRYLNHDFTKIGE